GKTALVRHAAAEARGRDGLVLAGACWDGDGTPGYWPWVQVVRSVERSASESLWAEARSAAGPALAALLGERRATAGEDVAFQIGDALTSLLVTASRERPVLVAIDDLHWADPASIRLLEFVVHH